MNLRDAPWLAPVLLPLNAVAFIAPRAAAPDASSVVAALEQQIVRPPTAYERLALGVERVTWKLLRNCASFGAMPIYPMGEGTGIATATSCRSRDLCSAPTDSW